MSALENAIQSSEFKDLAFTEPAVGRVLEEINIDRATPTDPKTGLLWAQPVFGSEMLHDWLEYDQPELFSGDNALGGYDDERGPSVEDGSGLYVAAFIDGDGYKKINYEHGHDGGDLAIISLANALKKIFRPDDMLLRYGGDEFVALIKNFPKEHYDEFASLLQDRLHKISLNVGATSIIGSASIGLANCPMSMLQAGSQFSHHNITAQAERALVAVKEARNKAMQNETPPTLRAPLSVELAQPFMRQPLEFAQIDPADRQADEIAIAAAKNWLNTTRAVMEVSPDATSVEPQHGREVGHERSVVHAYLQGLEAHDPKYYEFLTSLKDQIPPMTPDCRLAVNMPVHREAATIYAALEHMLIRDNDGKPELAQLAADGTTLDPSTYELTLAVNRPQGGHDDGSLAVIQQFIKDYDLPITLNALEFTLPAELANNGTARRVLHDVTLMRSMARAEQAAALYIIAEDADINGYDRQAFSGFVTALDEHPDLSAVRARTERDPIAMSQVPHLLMKHRFMTMVISLIRTESFGQQTNPNYSFRFNKPVPSGYGTSYVASDLVLAGGFPIAEKSTDLLLGDHLAVLYEDEDIAKAKTPHRAVGKHPALVVSSPRRELVAYIGEVDGYSGQNFLSTNDLTRMDEAALIKLAQEKPLTKSRAWLEDNLRSGINRIAAVAPDDATAERIARRSFMMLGFKANDYRLKVQDKKAVFEVTHWQDAEQLARQYKPTERLKSAVAK